MSEPGRRTVRTLGTGARPQRESTLGGAVGDAVAPRVACRSRPGIARNRVE